MATCPNCSNETAEGAAFCDQCGTRLAQPEASAQEAAEAPTGGSVICPACGAGNVPGEAFCDFCGSPMEAPVPSAEPVPELEPVSAAAELEAAPEPEVEPAAPLEPAAEVEAEPSVEGAPPEEAVEAEPVPAEVAPEEAPVAVEPVAEPEPVAEAVAAQPEPTVEAAVEAAPPPAPAPVVAALVCPACGVEATPGDRFCSNCGAAQEGAAAPVEAVPATPSPPAPAAGPRLFVSASGAEIPLPDGDELLIGREDPVSGIFPDVDLTPHGGDEGGVSRQHARIFVKGDNFSIEDLDSTNFTFVNKQKLAPKTRQPLSDGDEIRCGRVALILKTV